MGGLPDYQAELQNQCPRLLEHGIHLIVQQLNESGFLLIGDTHHFGDHADIWQDAASDAIIRQHTGDLLGCEVQAYQHWQGVYASSPIMCWMPCLACAQSTWAQA